MSDLAAQRIPYDVDNPHHLRLVRALERPYRASDIQCRISDVSSSTPCVAFFDSIDNSLADRYVAQLRSYTNEIVALGSASKHMAAEEVGGANFANVLRRLGLLSSPRRIEHERIKTCVNQLTMYTIRAGDENKSRLCRELEIYARLLR